MDSSINKFESMNKPISEDDGKSFFRIPSSELTAPSRDLKSIELDVPDKEKIGRPAALSEKKPVIVKKTGKGYEEYEKFRNKRDELTQMINRTADIMERLDMLWLKSKLADLSLRVKRNTFKIQIVGNFKNGKSTFINSFLGEEILPAYALPCTAVINEVKYGEKRAVIHFKNPLPPVLPKELPVASSEHIRKHSPGKIPPLEIPYEKIDEYVVIPMGKDPKDMLLESPYERVELFWPLPLLENGIEIIDSPGLNEYTARTKVTMDFLTKSDAIIFVLNATMLCSCDEMNFIEKSLHANGFKDLFFVINRFDMIPEKERERIMGYAKKNLVSMTNLGEKGLFFLSAKDALEAKRDGDEKRLAKSGLLEFESALSGFLTGKKGSVKLKAPARALQNFLQEEALRKIIPGQYAKLSCSAEESEKACDVIRKDIAVLERKRELFVSKIQTDIRHLSCIFEPMANEVITDIITNISKWVDDFTPTQKMGLVPTNAKVNAITDEIMEEIRSLLEKHIALWCQNEILPEISMQSATVFASVKKQVGEILEEYKNDETDENDVFRQINSKFMLMTNAKGVSYAEESQLAVRITGTPLLNIMSASSSSAVKAKAGALFLNRIANMDLSGMEKLKTVITDEVRMNIKCASHEYVGSVVGEITDYFVNMAEKVIEPLDNRIAVLKSRLDSVFVSRERAQTDIEIKRGLINQTEKEIMQLCNQIEIYSSSF